MYLYIEIFFMAYFMQAEHMGQKPHGMIIPFFLICGHKIGELSESTVKSSSPWLFNNDEIVRVPLIGILRNFEWNPIFFQYFIYISASPNKKGENQSRKPWIYI